MNAFLFLFTEIIQHSHCTRNLQEEGKMFLHVMRKPKIEIIVEIIENFRKGNTLLKL